MVGGGFSLVTGKSGKIIPAMNAAHYSLLTLRPDPERLDVLCVGVVILDAENQWHVSAPGPKEKLSIFGASADTLGRIAVNLERVLSECATLSSARSTLASMRSTLEIHSFEGLFSYSSQDEFRKNVLDILQESVIPTAKAAIQAKERPVTVVRQRTRARLRRTFENMGIFGKHPDEIEQHKVVHNFPVSAQHGLKAEFALKNSVMHFTETVDFEVGEDSVRTKIFEAQAKCLVLRAAHDTFGDDTKCHIVVSGSGAAHAARSVDLLSTVGELYATENAEDMRIYINRIALAAGNPIMPVSL